MRGGQRSCGVVRSGVLCVLPSFPPLPLIVCESSNTLFLPMSSSHHLCTLQDQSEEMVAAARQHMRAVAADKGHTLTSFLELHGVRPCYQKRGCCVEALLLCGDTDMYMIAAAALRARACVCVCVNCFPLRYA